MSDQANPEVRKPRGFNVEAEKQLSARASILDTDWDLGFKETVKVIARGWMIISYVWGRFTIKWFLLLGALMYPVFVLPWGAKIIVDHVVLQRPIEGTDGYPIWLHPLIEHFMTVSSLEILITLTVISVFLIILVGGYAPGAANDTTDGGMIEGQDTATKQENLTHGGHSFAGGIWGYYEYKMNSRLTQTVNHMVRAKLFERIKSMPMTLLDDQRIGDSVYRVMYDAPSINQIFYEVINRPTLSTCVFVAAMFNLVSAYQHVDAVIWLTGSLFPAYFLISIPFSRFVRRRHQASRAAGTIVTSTIEEGMDNMLAVQSLGGNKNERQRFGTDSSESFLRFRGTVLLDIFIGRSKELAFQAIFITVFWVIATNIIDGALSPGDYAAIFFYFWWMRGPADSFASLWIHLQSFVAGMRRVYAIMDLPQEQDLGDGVLPPIEQGVELRGVGLQYPDGRRALQNVSLTASIGQIVAFVGPTGAGKTSLAYLLPRYHAATEGQVLIDGHDVDDLELASLRDQITYVFQETQLFSFSILDNIRYGKPEASLDEVIRVAQIAGIHDFIDGLPEGYETKLGTTMSKLSVGQKQRISIARGLLRESKILILDEPTSALDPETEQYLVQSLHEAAKDRLVVIIAHRLSTIRQSDHIVFLDQGEVLEQGSHDELMAMADGHYRRFVDLQTVTTDD